MTERKDIPSGQAKKESEKVSSSPRNNRDTSVAQRIKGGRFWPEAVSRKA